SGHGKQTIAIRNVNRNRSDIGASAREKGWREQLSSIAAYRVRGKLAEEPPGEAVKRANKKKTKRKPAWSMRAFNGFGL
ncbi:MAG: hypothetical protein P8M53_05740, partial [Pirellulales bacterium]|nr:hypothetical protein [Pirellulales bacterium]